MRSLGGRDSDAATTLELQPPTCFGPMRVLYEPRLFTKDPQWPPIAAARGCENALGDPFMAQPTRLPPKEDACLS